PCAARVAPPWSQRGPANPSPRRPPSDASPGKAEDYFPPPKARQRPSPAGDLPRATFRVKFSGSKAPRSVTIRPSNVAQFTRDGDSALVEEWLAAPGVPPAQGGGGGGQTGAPLASGCDGHGPGRRRGRGGGWARGAGRCKPG